MPRKGWKKPRPGDPSDPAAYELRPEPIDATPPAIPQTCPRCNKIAPSVALEGVMRQLREMLVEFERVPPANLNLMDLRRFSRLQIMHARALIQLLIEDEAMFCTGHAPIKRGPREKPTPAPAELRSVPS